LNKKVRSFADLEAREKFKKLSSEVYQAYVEKNMVILGYN
jgi:hypothetical protein